MRSWLRRTAHKVESLVSSRLTQSWRTHRKFEEYYIGRLLTALNADCVLDVGANIGQYGLMLREYCGYRGLIVSFEPTPSALTPLRANSQLYPPWDVLPFALGRSSGQAIFHTLPGASVGNSLLEWRAEENIESVPVEVEVKRLGEIFPGLQRKFGFSRPFLKMDTQGFDLEVFAGADEALPSIIGLQSELSVEPFYEGAPDWNQALDTYRRAGFVLSTLVANNIDWFPRLREMDCLMYRPEFYPGQNHRP